MQQVTILPSLIKMLWHNIRGFYFFILFNLYANLIGTHFLYWSQSVSTDAFALQTLFDMTRKPWPHCKLPNVSYMKSELEQDLIKFQVPHSPPDSISQTAIMCLTALHIIMVFMCRESEIWAGPETQGTSVMLRVSAKLAMPAGPQEQPWTPPTTPPPDTPPM